MKPTKEQIKKFWEWCGWRQLPVGKKAYHWAREERVGNWMPPNETNVRWSCHDLPDIALDNLFQYAVPKLLADGFTVMCEGLVEDGEPLYEWCFLRERDEGVWAASDKDPAEALFWAAYKVMEGI